MLSKLQYSSGTCIAIGKSKTSKLSSTTSKVELTFYMVVVIVEARTQSEKSSDSVFMSRVLSLVQLFASSAAL